MEIVPETLFLEGFIYSSPRLTLRSITSIYPLRPTVLRAMLLTQDRHSTFQRYVLSLPSFTSNYIAGYAVDSKPAIYPLHPTIY